MVFLRPAVASQLSQPTSLCFLNSITKHPDMTSPSNRQRLKVPKPCTNSENSTRFNWTFMDAFLRSLRFLPFKMNDWRFFNVSQNQFLLCSVQSFSAEAAKKRRKKYLYLLIEMRKNIKNVRKGIIMESSVQ